MFKPLYFITLLFPMLMLSACNNEDDIDEIFPGKTWYMNGATINGMKLNSEISNFYTDAGEGAYYISFASNTFKGEFEDGVTFGGTWSANGKHQTITLKFTQTPTITKPFDQNLYNILSNIHSYKSGADFLHLKKDGDNVILFGNTRSKVIN
ncbi:MAG: DUF4847 family protein [Bacteroidaceae bacterium]|nr:DUF4847 family protein [Bacteroidaceae bacterium]